MSTDYRLLLIHVLYKIQFILNTFFVTSKKNAKHNKYPKIYQINALVFLYNLNQCKYSNVAQEVLQS